MRLCGGHYQSICYRETYSNATTSCSHSGQEGKPKDTTRSNCRGIALSRTAIQTQMTLNGSGVQGKANKTTVISQPRTIVTTKVAKMIVGEIGTIGTMGAMLLTITLT